MTCLFINTVLFSINLLELKPGKIPTLLAIYNWCMLLVNVATVITYRYNMRNLYLSHVYFFSQFIFVSLLYYQLFGSKMIKRIIVYVLFLFLSVVVVLYAFDPPSFFKFYIPEILLLSIPLMVYSVMYLYNSLETGTSKCVFFSAGLFIYLISSTLLFVGGNYIVEKFVGKKYLASLWEINNAVYLCFAALIIIEWLVNFRKPKKEGI